MTMSIEEGIKAIAEGKFSKYGFVLDDAAGIDTKVDMVDLPAIAVYLVEDGSLTFKNGKVKDSCLVFMAFIDKVDRDADGMDNVAVYQRMKEVAKRFIKAVNESGFFEPVDVASYQGVYEMMSSNVSGVLLQCQLKEAVGSCVVESDDDRGGAEQDSE